MALILKAVVKGMRPVGGEVEQGPRKGERWNFMSMELIDPRYGNIYSCQLNSRDKQYKEMTTITKVKDERGKEVEKHLLKPEFDWTGHTIQATISGISAGEREIEDKDAVNGKRMIIQVRIQVTKLKDLGDDDDDE